MAIDALQSFDCTIFMFPIKVLPKFTECPNGLAYVSVRAVGCERFGFADGGLGRHRTGAVHGRDRQGIRVDVGSFV
jgi:hypothetical protein